MIGYLGMLAQLADFNPRRKFDRSIREFRNRCVWEGHFMKHEKFMDLNHAPEPLYSDHAAHVAQHLEDLRI